MEARRLWTRALRRSPAPGSQPLGSPLGSGRHREVGGKNHTTPGALREKAIPRGEPGLRLTFFFSGLPVGTSLLRDGFFGVQSRAFGFEDFPD